MKHQNFNIVISLKKSKISDLCLSLQVIDYTQPNLFHGGLELREQSSRCVTLITKSRLTFLTNLTFYMVGTLKIRNMNIAEYCLFSVCLRCTIMQGGQRKVRKNNFCTKYFQYFQPSHFCHFILEVSIYCQASKNLIFH